jgi:class 3 adenylate cyclase
VVIRAITTALEISDLVYNLNKKYNFPGINVRLGLDFGPIIVERIGVRGKSELIIVGASAISAKKLESIGKSLDFIQNTTISLGCDFYHNLSSQYKDVCKQMSIPSDFRDYYMNYNSFYNYPRPYPIYNFYGRITNKL